MSDRHDKERGRPDIQYVTNHTGSITTSRRTVYRSFLSIHDNAKEESEVKCNEYIGTVKVRLHGLTENLRRSLTTRLLKKTLNERNSPAEASSSSDLFIAKKESQFPPRTKTSNQHCSHLLVRIRQVLSHPSKLGDTIVVTSIFRFRHRWWRLQKTR